MQKNYFEKNYERLLKKYNGDEDLVMEHITCILEGKRPCYAMKKKEQVEEILVGDEVMNMIIDEESPDIGCKGLLLKNLSIAMRTLTFREEFVIFNYFFKERSMYRIGREFDLSVSRISQILQRALEKLRHPSNEKYIKDFWYSEDSYKYSIDEELLFNMDFKEFDRIMFNYIDSFYEKNGVQKERKEDTEKIQYFRDEEDRMRRIRKELQFLLTNNY